MDSRVENYKESIKEYIKQGDIQEALTVVDSLARYAYQVGYENGSGTEDTSNKDKEQKEVYESLEEDIDNPKIDNPSHYQSYSTQINIDCITAMRAAFGDDEVAVFCKLNAFKYNWRADSKGKNVDIGKAIWYLNKYLELNK